MITRLVTTAVATAVVAAAALPIAATAQPTGRPSVATSQRGAVRTVEHVAHLSAHRVAAILTTDSFDPAEVRYGIDAYRLSYRTVDVDGRPTTASGLIVLPRDRRVRLRLVSYTHGTMAGRDEAPSVDSDGRSDEGMMLASAGYAAVEPDYLGLGSGPGTHPYMQLASEVSATLDMLLAADSFIGTVGRSFEPGVLVTGFSQGGDAAMAVGKALAHGADRRFQLAAVAPISGPYDLTGQELPAAFDGRLDPGAAAFYLAYLTVSYNRSYRLYPRAADVFAAPYDRTVAPLFDGEHDDGTIFAALPHSPQQLFTAGWLRQLHHPSGRLLAALRMNETACTGWRPAPIRIYAARGDDQVAFGNAASCRRQLNDAGVGATLIDTGNVGHPDSGRRGLSAALRWFEQIAPPTPREG